MEKETKKVKEPVEQKQANFKISTEIKLSDSINVRISKLREDAVIPEYKHMNECGPMDMGFDFTAVELRYSLEMDCYIYGTGLQIEAPQGTGLLLFPRASNREKDCYLANSVGIVDFGYAGEVCFCYKNRTSLKQLLWNRYHNIMIRNINSRENRFTIHDDMVKYHPDNVTDEVKYEIAMENEPFKICDRIGQGVIIPYQSVNWNVVDSIPDLRGGGFGSTGK